MDSTNRNILEAMIDSYGVEMTLSTLAQLCHEKAEHIRENWQDEILARDWERKGNKVQNVADSLYKSIHDHFNFKAN